jgi:hypothetical protein
MTSKEQRMKRTVLAMIAGACLLMSAAGSAAALPPNPVRDGARLDWKCENPVGRFTHGAYVSGVAQGYIPNDPVEPSCGDIGTE